MGLLSRLTGPRYSFEYRVMSEEMLTEIKKVATKLLIRGEEIDEYFFSSNDGIYIKDEANGIVFFKTGQKKLEKELGLYTENYGLMEADGELWKVIWRTKSYSDDEEVREKIGFSLINIPSKIGKFSTSETTMREYAAEALEFFEGSEREHNIMENSLHDLIFESEENKRLRENNKDNKFKAGSLDAYYNDNFTTMLKYTMTGEFKLEVVKNGSELTRFFPNVENRINDKTKLGGFSFAPRVYAVSDSGLHIARIFNVADLGNCRKEKGIIVMTRYYIMASADGIGFLLVGVEENPESGIITLSKIHIHEKESFKMDKNSILDMACSGIKCLAQIDYINPTVNRINDEKISYSSEKKGNWLSF